MQPSTYRLFLIGFGNVGQALARTVLEQHNFYQQQFGINLLVTTVADLSRGVAVNPGGLDLRQLLEAGTQFNHSGDVRGLLETVPYDILCEISFTDLQTGEPATSYIRTALSRGKHAVTTNKGPVALHYRELAELARANHVAFAAEGAVMSGTPVIRLGHDVLKGAVIERLEGILNGTTNYILSQMETGMSYAEALGEAQAKGYAEADPSGDVDGHDAAGKVAILANLLLDYPLKVSEVKRQGISGISLEDVQTAKANGERWKLVGRLERLSDGEVRGEVQPKRLPLSHPLAGVMGATNALTFTTKLLGQTTVIGAGAGRTETAYALLQDILAIHRTHGAER